MYPAEVVYSLVQWDWFSGITRCTWVTCSQCSQRTSFTAPDCTFFWDCAGLEPSGTQSPRRPEPNTLAGYTTEPSSTVLSHHCTCTSTISTQLEMFCSSVPQLFFKAAAKFWQPITSWTWKLAEDTSSATLSLTFRIRFDYFKAPFLNVLSRGKRSEMKFCELLVLGHSIHLPQIIFACAFSGQSYNKVWTASQRRQKHVTEWRCVQTVASRPRQLYM